MSVLDRKTLLIFLASLFAFSEAQFVNRNRRTSSVGRIIGGCIVAAVAVIFLLCLCMLMIRRRRSRARFNAGGPAPTTLWSGKPLFGGPWGHPNVNNEAGYGGSNAPQGSYGYQPSYNNTNGGGLNQQGPFNNGAAPPPPYQGEHYGPSSSTGQNYNAPPGPPPAAYMKGQ